MKIKNYKCNCGCKDFYFKESNGKTINTVGIYCSYCGKWFKWADKWEKNLMMRDDSEWINLADALAPILDEVESEDEE